ncbi:hypothetical protein CHL76_07405 [Marinococcus halophilus]|uniref:Uncharacterized protein n=1 Tax=Marinococcus halophilus TaxID=1371 RepID=A0A510Y4X6_MARHA|nr:hypothetical protein [Marinococcus halophilus]OZT80348.1 hypothetical protein CHL76_07405 [Marinococcus halophilus]GEK58409.1 hypothetical protein MHA01_13140 [Marinococcus halophilus]
MEPIYAALIIVAIIALGELCSISTRAKVPTLLVVVFGMLVLFQTGIIPESLVESSVFTAFGSMLVPVLLVHLGTMIPLKVLFAQYKAVLTALVGVAISVSIILLIVSFLFNYNSAVAGAGPISGGIFAYIITRDGLTEAGLTSLAAIPVVIFALQNLVGMPLTAILLRKYALLIRGENPADTETAATVQHDEQTASPLLFPDRLMQSSFFLLFLLLIGGSLATFLGSITGFINSSIWGLLIGIAGAALRIYPDHALDKANSSGITMIALIFVVIGSLVGITFEQIIASLVPALVIMALGTVGLTLGGWLGGKWLGWHPTKSIPVALTAMYGFPGDYLIVEEVSRSVGRTEIERKRIMDELVAPMLIGGFTSVSIGSIIIASILVGTLN